MQTTLSESPKLASDNRDLAAWLRSQADMRERAAMAAVEEYGQRISFATAKKLRQAADIVERSI
jgi:hypothetical protein